MALRCYSLVAALIGLGFLGCNNDGGPNATESPSAAHDDHDHGEHEGHDHDDHDTIKPGELGLNADDLPGLVGPPMPENFSDAVSQVGELVAKVSVGLGNGDVDSVHDELHDLGNALENAESLAKSSEQSDEVVAAVGQLFEAFGSIDAKLHGEEGKDFADVKSEIEAAMKNLAASQGK